MVRQRVRIHFKKTGNLCFIGHRDLLQTMERLFCRAHLPIAMSEGFHPKPRVSYLSALSLGFSGEDEVLELILTEEIDPDELLSRLNRASLPGLEFCRVVPLPEGAAKSKVAFFIYGMQLPQEYRTEVLRRIQEFMRADSVPVKKSNGKIVDVRLPVSTLCLDENNWLRMSIAAQNGPEAGVREILICLGLEKELFRSVFPIRERLVLQNE
ncbi:MAG: TIGR03936 family radical SAM-associated protein, partial [Thermoguttaceae bacterium]|nr:TIGR03936 family radical SAM-associated protein [Thermoguttaceae bacterium]